MLTKENKARKQQPYIPAGNPHGGEYTSYNTCNNQNSDNKVKKYSKEWFVEEYGGIDLSFLVAYTDTPYAQKLNRDIRNNTLTHGQKVVKDSIVNSINKNTIEEDVIVYRGISVDYATYKNKFVRPYTLNQIITGSTICSTSEKLSRAVAAAKNGEKEFKLVFITVVPKGCKALPVSTIAKNPDEAEILLASPKYRIKSILNTEERNFKKIVIKLER